MSTEISRSEAPAGAEAAAAGAAAGAPPAAARAPVHRRAREPTGGRISFKYYTKVVKLFLQFNKIIKLYLFFLKEMLKTRFKHSMCKRHYLILTWTVKIIHLKENSSWK